MLIMIERASQIEYSGFLDRGLAASTSRTLFVWEAGLLPVNHINGSSTGTFQKPRAAFAANVRLATIHSKLWHRHLKR
jgi:hypothetical protein